MEFWRVCAQIRVFSHETRADSKLQWRIVIAIFELPSVHTREKTSPSLWFSIPEPGEEAWLVFWHADWYFIGDRISITIRKCAVYPAFTSGSRLPGTVWEVLSILRLTVHTIHECPRFPETDHGWVVSAVRTGCALGHRATTIRACAHWMKTAARYQFSLSHIDDIGRYQLSISIFYFKVPGCVGRVTSASAVRCICMYVDGANIGWSMTTVLAELSKEIRWRTKDKYMYKIGLLFSDISEIHAVLAVLCEIDKATSLHACMHAAQHGMRPDRK